MDIDIILEADVPPAKVRELALEAERLGVRALWTSNYHQNWDCFLALAPAAQATSQILLGALAVSPWELHPLKMANAVLTLNELAPGRAIVAVSGGGGVLGAMGWKIGKGAPMWPRLDEVLGARYPERRVRGVRECIEVLQLARSGRLHYAYEGDIFQVTRPFRMDWANSPGPLIYGCCSGPQMIRMGARVADGIQVSDFTVDMMPAAMGNVRAGLAKRSGDSGRAAGAADAGSENSGPTSGALVVNAKNFRVGNFWAWHIKADAAAAMYEARRELIWRGSIAAKYAHELAPFCHDEAEVQLVIDNWMNFAKAWWTRSGQIDGVPEDLVNRLIAGLSSAGGLDRLEAEVARIEQFADSGLTELALRLFDDPMDGLKLIGEHVLPALGIRGR